MPDWKPEIRRRLARLQLAPTREHAIVEELAAHLDEAYAELLASGVSEADASRQVQAELRDGGLLTHELQLVERSTNPEPIILGTNRKTNMIADLWQDLLYGVRMLLKQPGFTLIAVITLSLGIGAVAAVFSVVNAVLLKPVALHEPARLVEVWQTRPQSDKRQLVTPADFDDWRQQSRIFAGLGAWHIEDTSLTGADAPERVRGIGMTANVFSLLGVPPLLGRVPHESEDRPGGTPVVVLSHHLWQTRFGADPNLIGQTVRINAAAYHVIGVMPERFRFPGPYYVKGDLWLLMRQGNTQWSDRQSHSIMTIARLRDGVTQAQAQAEMSSIAGRLAEAHPATNRGVGARLLRFAGPAIEPSQPRLLLLAGAAAFVLLIACVNVVNLLLSRGLERRKEIAVRAALGAGRFRLVRQLLTESLLLFLAGGALGLLVAVWGKDLIVSLRSFEIPRMEEATIDYAVVAFALLLALVAGVLAGLIPALRHTEFSLAQSLNESGRGGGAGRRGRRFQGALVVMETALTLVLLLGAGLMWRSFWSLAQVAPGFKAENLLHMRITLPATKYPTAREQSEFFLRAVDKLGALPGVSAVTLADVPPATGAGEETPFTIAGASADAGQPPHGAVFRTVGPEYFRTLEIPLRQGRQLARADGRESPRVALINETLARRAFPAQSPLGQRLQISAELAQVMRHERPGEAWEIVGVVADAKEEYVYRPAPPTIYVPFAQSPLSSAALLLRTEFQLQELTAAIRRSIRELDQDQPVYAFRTMEEMMAGELSLHRLTLVLLAAFSALSLLLAMAGICGVIAHTTAQRTREIGLRVALGAQTRDVLKLVIGQGMRLVMMGVGLGLAGAFALTRLIKSLLFGVSATDPATFVLLALLLMGVALLACYIPARRATQVDPMIALRSE